MHKAVKEEDIRLILGLKLKRARAAQQLSLAELAKQTGLSVSYLNEIEKGRKYPKAEKIAVLARALGTTFDKLVSLKLDKHLAPVGELLESGFLQELPLDLFGIDRGKLVELIANAPAKVAAFISTLTRIAATYDMSQEHFHFAALRSYQELHENHFPELEQAADAFRERYGLSGPERANAQVLSALLSSEFGYTVEESGLEAYPDLVHIRSVFIPERKKLVINARLAHDQKAFLYAKELGYAFMGLTGQRALMTPWPRATGFDHVLNNSKAGYFGGALLLPAAPVLDGLRRAFAESRFTPALFLKELERFEASPETYMVRLTNLVPRHLGITQLFFQRFDHQRAGNEVSCTKELFLERQQEPAEIEMMNDGVARWLREDLFQRTDLEEGPRCTAQRFAAPGGERWFVVAIGRRMRRDPQRSLALCVGFKVSAANEKVIAFLHDAAVPEVPLEQRPVLAEREARSQRIRAAMDRLLADHTTRDRER